MIATVLAATFASALPVRAGDDEPAKPITRVVKVVRAPDGAAFAGADVEAYGVPGGVVTKKTGDDGVARFVGVPRKGVTFVARSAGFACDWHEPGMWWWVTPPEDDDPDGDGVTTMTLGIEKGAEFVGSVTAFDDGSPVAGAHIEAWEHAGGTDVLYLSVAPTWTATTPEDGAFRTDRHSPRTRSLVDVRVTASAPGFISETAEHGVSPAKFRLRRAAMLRGTVVGEDGKPAAGVDVHAYPADFALFNTASPGDARHDEDEHPRVLHVRTDAQGRYAMAELSPGTKFFVYAERTAPPGPDDFGRGDPVDRSEVTPGIGVAKAGEETTCDLQLHPLSTLVVTLAPDAGGDSANTAFELERPARTLPWFDDEGSLTGHTWAHLAPGRYVLRIDADGWSPSTQTVELTGGKSVELTVRLAQGSSLEGVVVDDRGVPVPQIRVYAYAMDATGRHRNSREAKTDAAGAFRIDGLPVGPVDVDASGENFISAPYVRATAPATGLRLTVVREPRISLRVDAPPGASLPPKVRTTIVDLAGKYAGMRDLREVPPADLPATIDRVRPGPVDVVVDVPGFAPSTVRVELKPGETATAGPFAFAAGVELGGTVVDATGRPLAGARVVPYENDDRATTSGNDGRFLLPNLAAGPVDLCVTADDFPETRLSAATGTPLLVTLRPGGLVHGAITARDNHRVDQRRLCIFDAASPNGFAPHWHATAQKDLRYSIRLPAGRYRFVPSRYEFDAGAVFFDVTEGGETTADFVLP